MGGIPYFSSSEPVYAEDSSKGIRRWEGTKLLAFDPVW